MNYFLHYDNSNPLFIGGFCHGTKKKVELGLYHYKVAVTKPFDFAIRSKRVLTNPSIETETYRREWLAGETAEKFVSEQIESWLKDNPYPEKA